MNKYYFSILLVTSLYSNACWRNLNYEPSKEEKKRGIEENFAPGQDKGIYNKNVFTSSEGTRASSEDTTASSEDIGLYQKNKYIVIKTAKQGKQIPTSNSKANEETNSPDGLRTEGDVFMSHKVYELHYELIEGKGDHKSSPLLADNFLPASKNLDKPFLGTPDTEYKIVFRLGDDNYLWLDKASKELKNIPYPERTQLFTGQINGDTHYIVPFIGYPIKYCIPKSKEAEDGRELTTHEKDCENIKPEEAKYIHFDLSKGKNSHKPFKYDDEKKDLFEKKYFEGRWFYVEGSIEEISPSGDIIDEVPPRYTSLIEFNFGPKLLSLINISDSEEREKSQDEDKFKARKFEIVWREYEKYVDDQNFGERLITDRSDPTTSRFLTIDMPDISEEVVDVLVTPNYFSITYRDDAQYTVTNHGYDIPIPKPRYQISFYREQAVDSKDFREKKWFFDNSSVVGLLPTSPKGYSEEPGAYNEVDRSKFWRAIRFNLDKPVNKVTWYFSKNSTKDPYFRNIVKDAIKIYNQAFQVITQGTDKKITIELAEGEKELGDIRYNIVNLTYKEKQMYSNLLGVAPSYVNPLTGQIIGGTANIFLDNILQITYNNFITDYIRYEIFQKGKTAEDREDNNKYHVLGPYLRGLIEQHCQDDVLPFIEEQKIRYNNGDVKPYTNLTDIEVRTSCGKKISRDQILNLVLHEMGHNFGLAHNFIASADKDNHYENEAEIQQYFPKLFQLPELQKGEGLYKGVSKTSSVMEYLSLVVYPLTVLGKSDMETLRLLYTDQITVTTQTEPEESEIVSVETPQNPDKQKPLNEVDAIKGKKFQYKSCPDWSQSEEKFLCTPYDYGSTPQEIVEHRINHFRQLFNSERYLYDIFQPSTKDPEDSVFYKKRGNFIQLSSKMIKQMNKFYLHWAKNLRNEKFKGQEEKKRYEIYPTDQSDTQKEVIANYLDTICPYEKNSSGESPCRISFKKLKEEEPEKPKEEEPTVKEGITDEYLAYYKVRETLMHFVRKFILMKTMKCKVQDIKGDTRHIGLDTMTRYLSDNLSKTWYIEDCYSKSIEDFLNLKRAEGLKVVGQVGLENHPYYHSSYHNNYKAHKLNIAPVLTTKNNGKLSSVLLASGSFFTLFGNLRSEVDFLHDLRLELEEVFFNDAITVSERNRIHYFLENIKIYYEDKQNKELQTDMKTYITRYFGSNSYSTHSTHPESFVAQMRTFIQQELYKPEKKYEIPFLVTQYNSEAYQNHKKTNPFSVDTAGTSSRDDIIAYDALLFKDYLFSNYIVDDKGNKTFKPSHVLFFPDNNRLFIPLQEHSRAFTHFTKYNINQKRIKDLEEKAKTDRLTFFEQVEREHLQYQNRFIMGFWCQYCF